MQITRRELAQYGARVEKVARLVSGFRKEADMTDGEDWREISIFLSDAYDNLAVTLETLRKIDRDMRSKSYFPY